MTEQPPRADDDQVIKVDQTDKRSMAPFVAAAVLAVVVLVAIVLGGLLSPAEKNVTESEKITAAIRNYVEGLNSTDVVPPPGTTCQGFDANHAPPAGPTGAGKSVEITGLDNPMADGDRAKATVSTKVDGKEATADWNLTRSGDKWLVCN